MDADQLHELATNARLNHWPPHLGVTTDAEKIEYLAQRLKETADAEMRADQLAAEVESLREEADLATDKLAELESKVSELKPLLSEARISIKELEGQL